jgi:hypothetical protein
MGQFSDEPNVVKVTRIRKGPGDIGPREQFIGHLVDEYGRDLETPQIGEPIYLSGEDARDDQPWLFRSDTVFRLHVFMTHWRVLTENGTEYQIECERSVQ